MNSDVEDIKSRLNVVDVLGGYIKLDKAGANWKACCPFHNEKTPSFMVNEERQFWHCFGCQKSGDIFSFIMEMEGLEFKEALNVLAEKAGVQLKKHSYDPKEAGSKNRTLEILELATKFFEIQLWKGEGKIKIMEYLRARGLNDFSIKEFRLGYAPIGWRNMLTFLTGRGYKIDEIMKTGLLVEKTNNQQPTTNNQVMGGKLLVVSNYYDRFRDRIMFPIADAMGKIVGFSARVAPGGDESQAKYVNTPETEVYHKSKILYGIDKAKQEIKNKKFVLLVEGNMDVIAAHQAGIKNTVAVSGTALTPEQVDIIKRYADKIKMFFDMDSAGENATQKSVKLCFDKEVSVNIVEVPDGKDAADIANKNPAKLKDAVDKAKNIMDYFFENILSKYNKDNEDERRVIIRELLDKIKILKMPIDRSYWIKRLAESINKAGSNIHNEEKALTDMLKKDSLVSSAEKKYQEGGEPEVFAPREKSAILLRELAGLMLVHKDAWKKIAEEHRKDFLEEGALKLIIEKGQEARYDFDNFLKLLDSREDAERAKKIFIEKKYRLGLNNELEEVISKDPVKEAEEIVEEIKKERRRERLEKIAADLAAAEKANDKIAVSFLREQFKKIAENK